MKKLDSEESDEEYTYEDAISSLEKNIDATYHNARALAKAYRVK